MRKYVIGFIVGVGLTFALQAGAASLLGTTVDAVIQVEVDGENMGQAPVIDGVSYLPVRKFGNKAGYDVAFGEGKATLTNAIDESGTTSTQATETSGSVNTAEPVPTLESVNSSINFAESAIVFINYSIDRLEKLDVSEFPNTPAELAKQKKSLEDKKSELEQLYKIKAALEAQP